MRWELSLVLVSLGWTGMVASHAGEGTVATTAVKSVTGDTTVTFKSEDGVTIHGELYLAEESKAGPFLLLFPVSSGGGDGRSEYGPLVGRLMEAGFSALAIDQRVGGTFMGGINRTAQGIGRELPFCEAWPDLLAALRYAEDQGFTGPKIAWGSSYSGALVFRLAAEQGDRLAGVIAFSPASGPPMEQCRAEEFVGRVGIPALALRPASEMDRETSKAQMEIFHKAGVRTYVADPGVHGSSMLNADRVGGSVEATWKVVLEFLNEVAGKRRARGDAVPPDYVESSIERSAVPRGSRRACSGR